jgi:hypothetical protein
MAIDVEAYKPVRPAMKLKKWLPALNLLDSDRQALLDPVGWLTDSIVNASQRLLKEQFPGMNSLQDVGLGNVMCFEVQTGQFIQILYADNHWVTVSSDGVKPSVELYDSLFSVAPTIVKAQIAALLFTEYSTISIKLMDVQKQVSIIAIIIIHFH